MNNTQDTLSLIQYATTLHKAQKTPVSNKRSYLETQIERVKNTPTLSITTSKKAKFKI